MSEAPAAPNAQQPPKTPQFPPHNAPRVWLITNGASPVSTNLTRHLLKHGDYVVLCVSPTEIEKEEQRARDFGAFLDEIKLHDGGRKGSAFADTIFAPGKSDMDLMEADDDDDDDDDEDDYDGRSGAEKDQPSKMKPWRERLRIVPLDDSSASQAQSAVAEARAAFNADIDILLLGTPAAVIGTVEELAQSPAAAALVAAQFETNFFANVALVRAALPAMRARRNGHVVLLSGTTGHLGTPGIATYCASQWAMEGYCDSLAYEVAPFNVRVTVVQPNIEVGVLTNRLTAVPPLDAYAPDVNPAPLSRELFAGLLDRLEGAPDPGAGQPPPSPRAARAASFGHASSAASPGGSSSAGTVAAQPPPGPALTTGDMLSAPAISSVYAPLSRAAQAALVMETVFALAAVGGHDNPPARHIVGLEGVASVREKLKTVSEELEDFLEVSAAVDFVKGEGGVGAAG